ncbi:MAG: hypothetical protein H6Q88_214 [Anaeromyxobacteraceae bacterium]|nr:hypothetical protein [Anaeromyxobacteraceae bacterium]
MARVRDGMPFRIGSDDVRRAAQGRRGGLVSGERIVAGRVEGSSRVGESTGSASLVEAP